ncbi:MAG: TetR/AcrR family transcriptional regulator [Humibacter sp.]
MHEADSPETDSGAPETQSSKENGSDRREDILRAGIAEFREKGLAGARVDVIAKRANCNKQLIYYYFGDKAGLYHECLERMVYRSPEGESRPPAHDVQQLLARFGNTNNPSRDWGRLWLWEALEFTPETIVLRAERAKVWRDFVAEIAENQEKGEIDPTLDTELTALAILSIGTMPYLLPHLTEFIAGALPEDPAFKDRLPEFYEILAKKLRP